ncbi:MULTISPECIES: hypothetical protein [unclassified Microbacterium]|uniref:hypothetical protein n=1 Tax=unclassified Microbacterium TaxID=2609290 RepID=UPI0021A65354|nr:MULTISPECIES: hypothetical protein [unclassified Microbacterium]MCT1364101.1 hypothetical protein [Microbacterium sp. p3-SID131]MCT1375257.1 hypothetical protein [Microbacterium sp. p3-SID337]
MTTTDHPHSTADVASRCTETEGLYDKERRDSIPTREQAPTEGVAGALLYSVRLLGEPDPWGVTLTTNEASSFAELTIDIPNGLPESTKEKLLRLNGQRIYYTAMDRVYDDHFGNPSSSPHKSIFVTTVQKALSEARDALTLACLAHAREQFWDAAPAPVERDDYRYEKWWEAPDFD